MITKDQRQVRIGVLGCRPIAQFAHLDACRKARNAELYAICDVADGLRERMTAVHQPRLAYADYAAMLADEDVDAVIIAVADEFHFALVGLPTLPEHLDERFCADFSAAIRQRGLSLAALSGTFNMIAGDTSRYPLEKLCELIQQSGAGATDLGRDWLSLVFAADTMLDRLERLTSVCRRLDTRIITLCTGTCDPENMWRWHPDNVRRGVWKFLVAAMKEVTRIADRYEVTMAIEPETGNVINSAIKARMILDEVGSHWIKVVIDPANLFHPGDLPRMLEILDEAFEWLGPDIVLAHAKELSPTGQAGGISPGKGVLDWDHYLDWLKRIKCSGPLILLGLPETDVGDAVAFLRSKMGTPSGEN